MLGLQSSILQGFSKEGEALLTASRKAACPVKRGSTKRIEMKILRPFLNIASKITHPFFVVNKINKVFKEDT